MYKGYHRGGGTGADRVDPLPYQEGSENYDANEEVARIFLEYLPGGDLAYSYFQEIMQTPGLVVIPEEHLWRMLLCFAKAALVLGESHP